jgi:hypothetical protein
MAKGRLEDNSHPRDCHRAARVRGPFRGTNTSLHRLYAWSSRSERAYCSVPRNRGPNTTLLASMTVEGMGACLAVEGATTGIVFETYIEKVLVPSLRRGQVVVMDNLTAHKGVSESESSLRARAANSSMCHRTRRTSVPSKRPSHKGQKGQRSSSQGGGQKPGSAGGGYGEGA